MMYDQTLTEPEIRTAAKLYAIDPALLAALLVIEDRTGFLEDGRLRIRFDREAMRERCLKRRIDPRPLAAYAGDLCMDFLDCYEEARSPHPFMEYSKLQRIVDWAEVYCPQRQRDYGLAAIEACQYGRFALRGQDHEQAGYLDVETFVDALEQSEEMQLLAYLEQLTHEHRIEFLQRRDLWGFLRSSRQYESALVEWRLPFDTARWWVCYQSAQLTRSPRGG